MQGSRQRSFGPGTIPEEGISMCTVRIDMVWISLVQFDRCFSFHLVNTQTYTFNNGSG